MTDFAQIPDYERPKRPQKLHTGFRLSQTQREWLFKEAYRRDISQGEIIRGLIDAERNKKAC